MTTKITIQIDLPHRLPKSEIAHMISTAITGFLGENIPGARVLSSIPQPGPDEADHSFICCAKLHKYGIHVTAECADLKIDSGNCRSEWSAVETLAQKIADRFEMVHTATFWNSSRTFKLQFDKN